MNVYAYDPVNGGLVWVSHHHKSRVGKPVGTVLNGYVRYGNKYVHRLVWELMRGPVPRGLFVDHKDRDTSNNRLSNSRLANPSESSANRIMPNRNPTIGVREYRSKWRAYLNGKHLGTFNTYEEAVAARTSAMTEYHN